MDMKFFHDLFRDTAVREVLKDTERNPESLTIIIYLRDQYHLQFSRGQHGALWAPHGGDIQAKLDDASFKTFVDRRLEELGKTMTTRLKGKIGLDEIPKIKVTTRGPLKQFAW